MKKIILPVLLFMTFQMMSTAQSLSPEVLASTGDYNVKTEATLSWTLGELAVQTYSSGTAMLSQGFQQTSLGLSTARFLDNSVIIKLSPNPAREILLVSFDRDVSLPVLAEIWDGQGRLVHKQSFHSVQNQVNVYDYMQGAYLLMLQDPKGKYMGSIKFLKF
jgi:hypothetical protein